MQGIRIKKHFIVMLLVLLCFSGGYNASAESNQLYVTVYSQEKSNWCWAAAGKSIIKYLYGDAFSQCNLYMWGKGYSSCSTNETGSIWSQFTNMFNEAGVYNGGGVLMTAMEWPYIEAQINLKRPALALIAWTGGGGHFAVVNGYNDSTTDYLYWTDINYNAQSVVKYTSYSYFKSNANWKWTASRYNIY